MRQMSAGLCLCLSALVLATPAVARTVYVDVASMNAPAPWNNLAFTSLNATTGLLDTAASPTDIRLTVTKALSGPATYGSSASYGDAAEFAASYCRDSAYGDTSTTYGTAVFTNLDLFVPYTFTFYASRVGVTDNRETLYTVTGSSAFTATLDAANNSNRVAVISNVYASAAGTISLRLEKGANNTDGSRHFYLNAMKLTYESYADIATRGSTIVSNASKAVRINTEGTGDPIALSDPVTIVPSLQQSASADATVDTAGKTLRLSWAAVSADAASLTLGVSPNDGFLTAQNAGGSLQLTNASASALTVNAVVADNAQPSALVKSGVGPVVLTAANTFSGALSILQAPVILANSLALQNATLGSTGAVFDASVASHAFTFGNLTNAFGLALADSAGAPVALSVGNNNADGAFGGRLSGAGSLAKVGAGTLSLTAASGHSGGTFVQSGQLRASHTNALGYGAVSNNSLLVLAVGNGSYSGLDNALSGTGTVNVVLGTTSGTTYLDGDYSGFTGVWNVGTNSGGKARMNGADNAAATVVVHTNGTLWANSGSTHYASLVLQGGNCGESYGQLRLENDTTWAGPIFLANDITDSSDAYFGGPGTVTTGYISGVISDLNGAHPVAKVQGNSRYYLTNPTNTFAGQVWVRGGTLGAATLRNVGQPSSLGQPADATAGTIKIGSGGGGGRLTYLGAEDSATDRNIDLAGTSGTSYIEQMGAGKITFNGALSSSAGSGSKTIQFDGSGTGLAEFAGSMSDGAGSSVAVNKGGTATWTFSNSNTYGGGTAVSGGKLIASGSGALGSGAVSVSSRSTLVATRGDALGTGGLTLASYGILELAHDGTAETPNPITIGNGNNGTLLAGVAIGDAAVNHRIGNILISLSTLTVSRASSVLSGTPTVTAKSVLLSGGGAYTSTLLPVDAALVVDGPSYVSANAFSKTLRLDGTSAGNRINGPITNGIAGSTVSLSKGNSSEWTLAGTSEYSGSTTVSGGTLVLAGQYNGTGATTVNTNALLVVTGQHNGTGTVAVAGGALLLAGPAGAVTASGVITVSLNGVLTLTNSAASASSTRVGDAVPVALAGGRMSFAHPADGASYSESAGTLVVTAGSNTVTASRAAEGQTSTLTFSSLSRSAGTVDFAGEGLGADARNQIRFATPPALANAVIGPWATINGSGLAGYDDALGVVLFTAYTNIFALGPSTLYDNAAQNASINDVGTGGGITLAADVTRLNSLSQNTATPSTVTTAGKTMRAAFVQVSPGMASLTLGAAPEDGVLTALGEGGELDLINKGTGTLTVNAALPDNVTASSLVKDGPGDVVLGGAASYSGPTAVNDGSLVFSSAKTQTLAGVISGAGSLVKNGTNLLQVLAANTYAGATAINAGIVRPNQNTAFGAASGGTVTVASGATLDVGCTPDVGGTRIVNGLDFGAKAFVVQGNGVDGLGAIVNSSTGMQYNAFEKVTLAADTRFGGVSRWDIRGGTFAMNGYTLTKVGASSFILPDTTVTPGDSGKIDVTAGSMRFEASAKLNGSSTNTFTLRTGTKLELYKASNVLPWTLVMDGGSTLDAANISDAGVTTQNRWTGPVVVNGAVTLTGSSTGGRSYIGSLMGTISGSGPITQTGSANITFSGTNTFTGQVRLTGGTLTVPRINPPSEAGPLGQQATDSDAAVKFSGGTLAYTGAGDTVTRSMELYSTGGAFIQHNGTGPLVIARDLAVTANGTRTLTLRGTAQDGEFAGAITGGTGFTNAVTKTDSGAWRLTGNNSFVGSLALNMGTLTLTGTNAQGAGAISIGNAANSNAILRIAGNGAVVSGTGAFRVGYSSGAAGACYLTGGVVTRNAGSGDDSLGIGMVNNGAYGYFYMSGGAYTNSGRMNMAGSDIRVCTGIARIAGGSMQIGEYILVARTNGCVAVLTVEGGTLSHVGASQNITLAHRGGRGELNLTGGLLDNSGLSVSVRQGALREATGVVNVCKGTLAANMVTNYGATAWLNFNGGTLKASANTLAFVNPSLTRVTVNGACGPFAGGATIDTAGKNVTINAPLLAPVGDGIFGVTLADPGSGYVGEPYVMIEGGGGEGATAVANMEDDGTGSGTYRVAGVTITNPGWGYTSDPTVTFYKGGTTNSGTVVASASGVTRSATTSGGLVKTGAGILTLAGASTYTGSTVISNGVLRLGVANALPPNAAVTLAGGTYDLGGFSVTQTLTFAGGAVTNGTLRTDISPAGAGTLGTQSFSLQAGASLQGTYYADVGAAGAADMVNVTGSFNLSSLSLQLVNPEALDRLSAYPILSVTGTVSGRFASTNLPDSRWRAVPRADGKVYLLFVSGTLLSVR